MATKARLIFQGENRTKQAFNQINQSLGRLGGSVSAVSGSIRAMGALLAGGLLARAGKDSLQFADRIDKLNARLGASTEFLSQMRFAAEQTGVSFETFTMGLQRMQRRVAEAAAGTGEAKDALRELGLDAKRLAELSLADQFDVIAEALDQVGSSGDRTRLAMKLFDSEGVALLQTMEGGAEAVRGLRAEADKLGVTLSSGMAEGAARANESINRISTSFRGLIEELAINFAPGIEAVANFLANAIPRALNLAQSGFSLFTGALARALAGAVGILRAFADRVAAALRFFNAPGADTLQGAADRLRDFENNLSSFGQRSIQTSERLFNLALGVKEVAKAAEQGQKPIQDLKESVSEWDWLDSIKLRGGNKAGADQAILDAIGGGASGENPFQPVGDSLADALTDGMLRGGQSMKDAFRNILTDLASMMLKSALVQGLTNLGFGGLFKGPGVTGKQAGGAVSPGRAYLVGETGPELFVPNTSGVIAANGGSGGPSMVFQIDARGAAPGVGAEVEAAIRRAKAETTAHILDLQRRGRFR